MYLLIVQYIVLSLQYARRQYQLRSRLSVYRFIRQALFPSLLPTSTNVISPTIMAHEVVFKYWELKQHNHGYYSVCFIPYVVLLHLREERNRSVIEGPRYGFTASCTKTGSVPHLLLAGRPHLKQGIYIVSSSLSLLYALSVALLYQSCPKWHEIKVWTQE